MRSSYVELINHLLKNDFESIKEIGDFIFTTINLHYLKVSSKNNKYFNNSYYEYKNIKEHELNSYIKPINIGTVGSNYTVRFNIESLFNTDEKYILVIISKDFKSALIEILGSKIELIKSDLELLVYSAIKSIKETIETEYDETIVVLLDTDCDLNTEFKDISIDYITNSCSVYFIIPNYKQYIEFIEYIRDYVSNTRLEGVFNIVPLDIESLKTNPYISCGKYSIGIKVVSYDITTLMEAMKITFEVLD